MRRESTWQWARIDLFFPMYQLSALPATVCSSVIVTFTTLFTVMEQTPTVVAGLTIFFVLWCCQLFGECLGILAVLNTGHHPPAAYAIHCMVVPLQAQCGFASAMDYSITNRDGSADHPTMISSGHTAMPFNTTVPRKCRHLFSADMGLGGWSSICIAVAVLSGEHIRQNSGLTTLMITPSSPLFACLFNVTNYSSFLVLCFFFPSHRTGRWGYFFG